MGAGIIVLVFSILLFLIFRALVLWYWRVNEALDVLKSMDAKLAQLIRGPQPPAG